MKKLRILGKTFSDEQFRYVILEYDKSHLCLVRIVKKSRSAAAYAVGRVVVVRGKHVDAEGREYAAQERFEAFHNYREEGAAREAYRSAVARAGRAA